jgi:pSer/pThr/pTyr-binding forkhead associated (FHA) protein
MRAQLVPLDGGSPIEIQKDVTLVGRKECCDLRLKHPSVSKLHALLVKTDGAMLFRDLGSTNGTKVNGQRARSGVLLPNDKLSIAACKFRVRMAGSEAEHVPGEHTEMIDRAELESPVMQALRPEGGNGKHLEPRHPEDSPPLLHDNPPESPLPVEVKEGSVDLPSLPASDSGIRLLFQD